MKILKLPAYYAPENISSSHLTGDLEAAYINAGYEIEVYAPTPTRGVSDEVRKEYKSKKYEETFDGKIKIHRFSMSREGKNPILRAIRYLRVNLKHYRCGKKAKDIDIIMAGSTPPTQGVLCAKVAKKLSKKYGRKVPFVYNLQDVFPDSLVHTGLAKEGGLLWKIGRKIEAYTYRNADAIIVISEDIKRNIMEKGVPEEKIHIIPNWVDTDEVKPVEKEKNNLFDELALSKDSFKVVYAGNLGKAQGISVALDAAEILKDNKNIEFIIFGKGLEEEKIKKRAETLENVKVFPLMPADRISEVYSLGDVSLIMCKKGTGGAGLPSKTWSIMACMSPIIVSFDEDSELSRLIHENNCGISVPPENAKALSDAIFAAYSDRESLAKKGENCYNYVLENASARVCPAKYVELIKSFAITKSVSEKNTVTV